MHVPNSIKAIILLLATTTFAQDTNNGESDTDSGNTRVAASASASSTTSESISASASASASSGASSASVAVLATSSSTSVAASETSSTVTLKLAKKYIGQDFMNDFDYFTADDPTNGYVNYISKSAAQKQSLIDVQANNVFYMAADSTNVPTGRGRDSIRISSKDKYADGVYILDLNHMPVGCGTWPAFWTVTKSGWPKGGEIDILEATNPNPQIYNVAALHTADTCTLNGQTYMDGQIGEWECSAYLTGNTGCGVKMTGATNGSYGGPVNGVGGGWYAMWRDVENSAGIYIWFWPRNSADVPEDVKVTTTNVANWGIPKANMTVPACKSDFNNHNIIFDLTFCGDYAGATYASSGCPGTCATFVQNYPAAFSEAYWSINSVRVYNASGKPAAGEGLSKGAIAGIVVGVVAALALVVFLYLRRRKTRKNKKIMAEEATLTEEASKPAAAKGPYAFLASRKPRIGPTTLAPGRTAQHFLDGETPTTSFGKTPIGSSEDIRLAQATYRPHGANSSWIG
uniref:GH16 domain-containing protein n=1 Tax=Kwoniella pini CBS 10737 TaxID=1296096 RepID=A0A1B9I1Y3_9TREE|nr:uncharacterized protein I206_04048 [Kwoniella pini CBS 10737]OCF49527.1 hypothetical protein I206_04048 [Kwoniella pini CBS 10737]